MDNLQIKKESFNAFSEQFMTDKHGDSDNEELKKMRQEYGLYNVDFKSVFLTKNEDIIVNTEELFIRFTPTI